jgi:hypothetical protein
MRLMSIDCRLQQIQSNFLPCGASLVEVLRSVVTPTFSRPDTCLIYRALASMYANLCFEKELLTETCGKTQTLLKDSHLADRVDCTLDK